MARPLRPSLLAAAAIGLGHAGVSLYWALGGRLLVETVGERAVDLAESAPGGAALLLGVVALVKAVGAVAPLLVDGRKGAWARTWRVVCRVGGVVLVLYGGANTVGAWLVLAGLGPAGAGADHAATLGHAVLWDPLFLLWGVLLLLGLQGPRPPVEVSAEVSARRAEQRQHPVGDLGGQGDHRR